MYGSPEQRRGRRADSRGAPWREALLLSGRRRVAVTLSVLRLLVRRRYLAGLARRSRPVRMREALLAGLGRLPGLLPRLPRLRPALLGLGRLRLRELRL